MSVGCPRAVRRLANAISVAALLTAAVGSAHADPLKATWMLDASASKLNFQTIKESSMVESNSFGSYDGKIDLDGTATISIALESVDTKIDLRDVRLRFMLFEVFKHPVATITTKLDRELLEKLAKQKRVPVVLDYTLDLHGISKQMSSPVIVTLMTDSVVSVSSAEPITITAADFGMSGGIEKLEEAGSVEIAPFAPVSFDFVFKSSGATKPSQQVASALPKDAVPKSGVVSWSTQAVGTARDDSLTRAECEGRFATIAGRGGVNFRDKSDELLKTSESVLEFFADAFQLCKQFKIAVTGHTDSNGDAHANLVLSQKRAKAVTKYLVKVGVAESRLRPMGFGEAQPLVSNDTEFKRSRNRRIEFRIDDG